ncbi:hypothetical protein IV203_005864 [Nitzschia inconspicua]|uniref:Uncharacterized protein n=1 Tax=Nitzschia inconspicua TaxID=303405 RepID=A0A9K3PGX7_9STRA|nr:hypothetical protein IV203_005864 [Nitzschia inconspicua]
MPSTSEEEQAFEAIQSLSNFHSGGWRGRANSFTVTPDIAAGVVQRKVSPEYNITVKLAMTDKQEFSLSETISWEDNNKLAFRTIPMQGTDFDVDAVDASYSLDTTTLSDFPFILSGTKKSCVFLIEHCIATGENRRSRCFALYGEDESLVRVVISNEERMQGNNRRTNGAGNVDNDFTAKDLLEMQNDVDRLVDKIVSRMNPGDDESSSTTSSSMPLSPSPAAPSTDFGDSNSEEKSSALSRLSEIVESSEGSQDLALHDVSLLEISSGVWLGDAIIRDVPGVSSSPTEPGRGFASPQGVASDKDSWKSKVIRPFGSWAVGVQKIAWRWMWNFGEEIRQVVDVGKALGSPLEATFTKSLAGNVCVDESLSRRIPKEERMVYIDWSQHDSVGFLIGSCAVQVPRYLSFDPSAGPTSRALKRPFFTEFSVFQRSEGIISGAKENNATSLAENKSDDDDAMALPELICSKISRLYNYEGKLKQGCSSFYTFQRFGLEDNE